MSLGTRLGDERLVVVGGDEGFCDAELLVYGGKSFKPTRSMRSGSAGESMVVTTGGDTVRDGRLAFTEDETLVGEVRFSCGGLARPCAKVKEPLEPDANDEEQVPPPPPPPPPQSARVKVLSEALGRENYY